MITVFGEGRGFRVVWLLEEMGLAYRLRPVDLRAGVENDPEFLAINPAGFIPAIQDGDVTMVESIAIMEYLMARYGPTPLAPAPQDPAFPAYQQFLHLGEAGLAASIYFVNASRNLAPEAERQNWGAGMALELFESRRSLVTRQLSRSPYLAGDAFSAADISITYALELAQRGGSVVLVDAEQAYVARTSGRDAYKRAMETCHDTRAWVARVAGSAAIATNSRPAVPADIPRCLTIRGQTRENAISAEQLAAIGITEESWIAELESGSLTGYVYVEDGSVVGYCFGENTSGEVVVLALLPSCERRGVGRHLLGLVVAHLRAQGHRRLFLGCSRDPLVRSHGFYRHLGWVATGSLDSRGDEVLELVRP